MRSLILIKHSMVTIDTTVSAQHWRLSEEGRERCTTLADQLALYHPTRIVASQEPKATETGQLVAARLGLPFETAAGLGEHDRTGVPFGPTAQFEADVARFFAQPGDLVHGRETADEAYARFSGAVQRILNQYPDDTLAIVTHGTVLSLFVARHAGIDPFPLWKSLHLPSFVVLSLPNFAVLHIQSAIGQSDA
jgi:broad specificity phosphatase PhoE